MDFVLWFLHLTKLPGVETHRGGGFAAKTLLSRTSRWHSPKMAFLHRFPSSSLAPSPFGVFAGISQTLVENKLSGSFWG